MSEEKKDHWIVYPIGSKPKWGVAVLLSSEGPSGCRRNNWHY
jgi:hypothetical protein